MRSVVAMLASGILAIFGCNGQPEAIKAGTLYSVDDGEGHFRVAKILAKDSDGVHIRLYKNRYATRPTVIDQETLSLGSIHDADGFGMGHLPLTQNAFDAWKPVYLGESAVTFDELDGYREWQSANGGYFGNE